MPIDLLACGLIFLLAVAAYWLCRWRKRFENPTIYYSVCNELLPKKALSYQLFIWLAIGLFACAFIDPHWFIDKRQHDAEVSMQRERMPVEGIAIYLVLDQSGSMQEKIPLQLNGRMELISKVDLLKQVTQQFIRGDQSLGLRGRPDDLIGLVFFARAARVVAPLTLDHRTILQQLEHFDHIKDKDQDGTSIGYAIYKTADLIAATRHYAQDLIKKGDQAYVIKNSIIILITDGLQDPNPLDKGKRLRNIDVPEAAEYAKEQKIRLYIINVEPKLATEEFSAYRHIMQRAAESTGGNFYMIDLENSLDKIYREIDQIEKSALPDDTDPQKDNRPDLYRRISLFPWFISLGLLFLFIGLFRELVWLRRIP